MPIIGRQGRIEFKRAASYSGTFDRSSINTAQNRIEGVTGQIATGDKVRLTGAGGIPLDVNEDGYGDSPGGHLMYRPPERSTYRQGPARQASGSFFYRYRTAGSFYFYDNDQVENPWLTTSATAYIGVNELGYARLYPTFAAAINDTNRLTLFDETTPFTIEAIDGEYNLLGDVTGFTLNTSRNQLDIDAIGEVFGESIAGKVTGSGSLNCFFTIKQIGRRPASQGSATQYLYELALRTAQGQDGTAKLYINKSSVAGESIYYETPLLITQSALNVQPDQIVAATIDFVTSGPISLKVE